MTEPVKPFAQREMLEAASRGLGKIDLWGPRGATLVSMDEIEAMACVLALLGLVPTEPGRPAPAQLMITDREADHG